MKKILLIFAFCTLPISHLLAQGYTYVYGVTVSYDNAGNRLVRQMQTFCIPGYEPCPATFRTEAPPDDSVLVPKNETLVETKIIAYPNPVSQNLSIENDFWHENDNVVIKVIDMSGNEVISQDIHQSKDVVPFLRVAPGTYIVQYYLNNSLAQEWKIIRM